MKPAPRWWEMNSVQIKEQEITGNNERYDENE